MEPRREIPISGPAQCHNVQCHNDDNDDDDDDTSSQSVLAHSSFPSAEEEPSFGGEKNPQNISARAANNWVSVLGRAGGQGKVPGAARAFMRALSLGLYGSQTDRPPSRP